MPGKKDEKIKRPLFLHKAADMDDVFLNFKKLDPKTPESAFVLDESSPVMPRSIIYSNSKPLADALAQKLNGEPILTFKEDAHCVRLWARTEEVVREINNHFSDVRMF